MTDLVTRESEMDSHALENLVDVPEDVNSQTLLHSKWAFYYLKRSVGPASFKKDYQEAIEKISNFQTVEHFWRIYDHMLKPNDVKGGNLDYHLFKNDIKPAWEDNSNKDGGKWLIKCKKGLASRYWEELVLAVIGEQFDVGHEICGIVISMRNNEDRIGVWNKSADNQEAITKIRDHLRRILMLPSFVTFEYQRHFDRVEAITGTVNTNFANITTPVKWSLTTSATGDGSCSWKDVNENIIFHFNPRPKKGIIAMNIQTKGVWQTEETCPLPVNATAPYRLTISVANDGYSVIHEGTTLHTFAHRVVWGSFHHVDPTSGWNVEGNNVLNNRMDRDKSNYNKNYTKTDYNTRNNHYTSNKHEEEDKNRTTKPYNTHSTHSTDAPRRAAWGEKTEKSDRSEWSEHSKPSNSTSTTTNSWNSNKTSTKDSSSNSNSNWGNTGSTNNSWGKKSTDTSTTTGNTVKPVSTTTSASTGSTNMWARGSSVVKAVE